MTAMLKLLPGLSGALVQPLRRGATPALALLALLARRWGSLLCSLFPLAPSSSSSFTERSMEMAPGGDGGGGWGGGIASHVDALGEAPIGVCETFLQVCSTRPSPSR